MKSIYFFITILIATVIYLMLPGGGVGNNNVVYVYTWSGVFTDSVIEKFEKETGIKVVMDFYDSNEALESKLMMGNSGYDVVFPSALPFARRQIAFGAYEKIDKEKIPNIKNIHPKFIKSIEYFDKNMDYFIPQLWGTIGFMYDEKEVSKLLGGKNKIHRAMDFYKVENLKKLSKCGVSMLSEPGEFIPLIMLYLGYDINSTDRDEINKAIEYGKKIRKYIKSFQTFKATEDLYSKEICVALVWSGQYIKLLEKLENEKVENAKADKENPERIRLRYLTPSKITPYWIDGIAIPKNAPNKDNAHKFINFILRPDIAALISQFILEYSTIPESDKFMKDFARKNLKYSDKMLQKLTMIKVQTKEKNRLLIDGMREIITSEKK